MKSLAGGCGVDTFGKVGAVNFLGIFCRLFIGTEKAIDFIPPDISEFFTYIVFRDQSGIIVEPGYFGLVIAETGAQRIRERPAKQSRSVAPDETEFPTFSTHIRSIGTRFACTVNSGE